MVDNYDRFTIKQLRDLAAEKEGLSLRSGLRKAEIVYRLREWDEARSVNSLAASGSQAGHSSLRPSFLPRGHSYTNSFEVNSATMPSRFNSPASHQKGGFHAGSQLQFRPSPFFEVIEQLGRPVELPPYPQHRNQVTLNFTLSPENSAKLRGGDGIRVMLYCAAKSDLNGGSHNIAFPSQLEVKVNEQEVRANFKGLKNKPGSTLPADITAFVRKQSGTTNSISTTYALTQKGFTMIAMLVLKRSVNELVGRIRAGRVIAKETVLREMRNKADDAEIEISASIMTLKDPVSYMRIAVPCRSDVCKHHQCFDAASFLQLQEQAPQWSCPICNKVVSFEGLVVDQYFEDILRSTSSSTTEVTVQPDGRWSNDAGGKSNGVKKESDDDDSDDDLIEIVPSLGRQSFGGPGTGTPYSFAGPTPPLASPAAISAAVTAASGSRLAQKRRSEVIDLTLTDDDEPAPKRPAYHTPNSLPDQGRAGRSNGYQNYPNQVPYSSFRANKPIRFQINPERESGGSKYDNASGAYNRSQDRTQSNSDSNSNSHTYNTNNDTFFSGTNGDSNASRFSGSALAPINLTESPPSGGYSMAADLSFDYNRPTIPSLTSDSWPDHSPIQSPQHNGASTINSRSTSQQYGNPEQRDLLRHLANGWG